MRGFTLRKQKIRPFIVFMSCWNLSILNHFLLGNTSVCTLVISPHPAGICGLCSKTLLLVTRVGIRLFSVCRWHGNKRIPRSLVFFLTRTNYVWQHSWVHRKAFPTSAPSVSVSFLSRMNKHCHPHLWMRWLWRDSRTWIPPKQPAFWICCHKPSIMGGRVLYTELVISQMNG